MKPTCLGWVAILIGLGIFSLAALSGFNLLLVLLALVFIIVGGLTKGGQVKCPHCKSSIDKSATVCPKCTRDVRTAP